MPRKSDNIPINNPTLDKRVKLTEEQRRNIKTEYEAGNISYNELAKKYGVSKRLITFIVKPERQKIAKQQYAERRKDGRYYDKEKHKEYTKRHRDRKKKLYEKGLLKEGKSEDEL